MSFPTEEERSYASLTSENVMPPAMKTIMRSRLLDEAPPLGGALCQLGLELRKEVVGGCCALKLVAAGVGVSPA